MRFHCSSLRPFSFLHHIFSHVLYFIFVFIMQPFEHFNVIALYKCNIIIIIIYY